MFVDPAAIWMVAMSQYIQISPILAVSLRAKREKGERQERRESEKSVRMSQLIIKKTIISIKEKQLGELERVGVLIKGYYA